MRYLNRRRIEAVVFLALLIGFFSFMASYMTLNHLLSSLMNTAHDLLLNTVFYILAITVLAGALGKLMIEFGVVRLLEFLLAPFMKPLFNLPGVAAMGGLMTFFSDNPAIISLAKDKNFSSYFHKYQLLSLTNFGTAFGMGLVVITFMIGKGFFLPAIIGLIGATIGAIFSTRIMQMFIKKILPKEELNFHKDLEEKISFRSEGSTFMRALNATLDGGKQGVDLGIAIIPGVLIISTLVMLLTFGPADASIGYQGLPYEGVPVLPKLGSYVGWLFRWLFGFKNAELIAFPITSLGAVGAALSLVPKFIQENIIGANEIAVFTAMGMCWSGYLSTHTAMLDSLNHRELTSRALISHTIGGLAAGISAHYIIVLLSFFHLI
ncbi:MAG TPA: hypothetical protein PLV22_05830 [Candidatus Cloacimonadota bacterium]|nr:hypothetical protein [Candidatus Cloacimonadota bacterium]HOQ80185.1 hypothetical protein [Candidatus Cloacimonadota bacterium]